MFVFELSILCILVFLTLINKRDTKSKNLFFKLSLASMFVIALSIIFTFIVYNVITPIGATKFTISDGNKTIVFQGLIHRGTGKYYSEIHKDIINKRKDGFAIVREGINDKPFTHYNNIDTCDISYNKKIIVQPVCIGQLSINDYNFDINNNDIENYFNNLDSSNDFVDEIVEESESRKDNTDDIKIRNGLVNLSIKYLISNGKIEENSMKHQDLIIDVRDEKLHKNIVMIPNDKVYILYGLAHFQGLYQRLKLENTNWKIISKEFIY